MVGDTLRLSFTAPVEAAFLRVSVDGSAGPVPVSARIDPVDPQAVLVPLSGPAVGATVRWRVLSRDGHATAGTTRHDPGGAGPTMVATRHDGAVAGDWVAGAGRGLVLLGGVLALGLVAFRLVVVDPAVAAGGLAPPGAPPAEAFRDRAWTALAASARGWHGAWRAAAGATLAGAAAIATGTLLAVAAGPADLGTLVGDTRVGAGVAAIAVAALTGLGLGAVARRGAAERSSLVTVMGLPPAVALGAMSWMGHASSGNDVTLNVGADMVHNAATAAWIGGLLGLLAYLLPAGRALADADRVRLVAQGVVRFSTVATVAVALLVITGVYRALAEVGALDDLLDTGYGVALLVKLVVFAVMLGAGGYNRFVLHPRLERAALGLPGGEAAAAERLAASVRAELALAALLLVSVAVLVSNAPTA